MKIDLFFIKQTETYRIIKHNVPNRNWAKVIILITSMIGVYITTYLVVCMQKLIDAVTDAIITQDLTVFKTTIVITLCVIGINTFISIFRSIFEFYLGFDFVSNTSKFLFSSFYKQDFNFPKQEGNDSGIVASKFTEEANITANWLLNGAITIWQDLVSMLIKFGMLYRYSPMLSGVCVSFVMFAFIITRKLNKKLALINNQILAAESELLQFYVQAGRSFVDVKQLQKENLQVHRMLDILNNKVYKYKTSYMYWSLLYNAIFSMSSVIFPMAVLIGGLYFAIRGKHTIGEIMAMYQLVKMAQEPLNGLAADVSNWKNMMLLTKRLDCFMPPNEDLEQGKVELQSFENLKFDCEEFAYTEGDSILKNVHFEIKNGDIFCIKGKSGIGKSTISKILMRFNELKQPSAVTVNGIEIHNYSSASFYKKINFLNQEPYIFQDNLINNITMEDEYLEDDIAEVIKVVQLQDFVNSYGHDYILKEDANNISGGQKQRIGLARMLIRKPSLLILDEPTAALDTKTASDFVSDLKNYADKYNITLLIITHSNVFDDMATQVLNLDNNMV